MIYLRSKRIFVFFLVFFLFFLFEGTIHMPLEFFPKRSERDIANEIALVYQKISDLEKMPEEKANLENAISANIIFGGGYIFSDSIFLDKGIEDGVEKGDFVVYKSTIAVGKIEEMSLRYSKAVPFSRFSEKVTLRSGPEKSVLFEAEGQGGRKIVAFLPSGSGVSSGDSVYLAENPRFLVGIVEVAEKKESRDFEEISIVLPFSLRSIVEAGIIKNYVE